jgi:hypothetical protein
MFYVLVQPCSVRATRNRWLPDGPKQRKVVVVAVVVGLVLFYSYIIYKEEQTSVIAILA